MKPILKKICKERGIEQDPGRWQENGWAAKKCPTCNHALHTNGDMYECNHCGLHFKRKGWQLDIADPSDN